MSEELEKLGAEIARVKKLQHGDDYIQWLLGNTFHAENPYGLPYAWRELAQVYLRRTRVNGLTEKFFRTHEKRNQLARKTT